MTDATTTPTDKAGEPVAWMRLTMGQITHLTHIKSPGYVPLYTHPQPSLSVGLDREALRDEVLRLRAALLGIAETDRYRRYPKQHEDGGIRGQSGLRAVRALTGKHGSYINDDEVRQLNADAIFALSPPAEGVAHLTSAERAYGEERAASIIHTPMHLNPASVTDALGIKAPTPAPVDHIGDATEKVDWERVGPKLVEALERAVADYLGDDWRAFARAALAAAQPQSNGE